MTYLDNAKTYHKLIKEFIDGTLDGLEFEKRFYKLWEANRDWEDKHLPNTLERLMNEPETERTKNDLFRAVASRIFTACDVFEPNPDLRDPYEYSEEELRNFVRDIYEENTSLFGEL